ncbi:ankyrin repeat domain-containing protein [Endozoicomonas sp. GU-1]|uniref:ankyrin repeat domain-containing protein n=1 Tax=Endozoicomonas sp. GU-1 TaxID=3009078 RepID=UPI003FA40714
MSFSQQTRHKNNDGYIALMLACKNGHKEIVELLISQGADLKPPGQQMMPPRCTSQPRRAMPTASRS